MITLPKDMGQFVSIFTESTCIRTNTHTHTCNETTCVHAHTHAHTHTRACVHAHNTESCKWNNMHTYTCRHAHTPHPLIYKQDNMCACAHAQTDVNKTRTHTHMHTHHTYIQHNMRAHMHSAWQFQHQPGDQTLFQRAGSDLGSAGLSTAGTTVSRSFCRRLSMYSTFFGMVSARLLLSPGSDPRSYSSRAWLCACPGWV